MREIRFDVDGESVAGVVHDPPRGKPLGAIVLVHGFLSQHAEFAGLAEALAARGWRAVAFDQRGFGASGGARGRISTARAVADIKGAIRWTEADYPELPIGLVGHSMGACFTLAAMATEPRVKAAALAAPMSSVRAEVSEIEFLGYKIARNASNLAERFGFPSIKVPYKYRERDLFKDPEAVRRAQEAGFLGRKIDLANFNDLLGMDSRAYAPHVKSPVLVILASHDHAVKHASSRAVYDGLAGVKDLVTVDAGHSMFGDAHSDVPTGHVERWFRRHLLAENPA